MTKGLASTAQPWLIKHAALAYANQWFMTDRGFLQELRPNHDLIVSAEPIGRLAAKYMVARHFKKPEQGQRDHRWTKVAKHLRQTLMGLSDSVVTPTEIHALAARLGKVAPTREGTEMTLLSAATKFLWFAGQHNVRILDKRAVASLSELEQVSGIGTNYGEYRKAWENQFEAHEAEICDAIRKLPSQLRWSRISFEFHSSAASVFQSAWFKDRVFDKYLWIVGAESGGFE